MLKILREPPLRRYGRFLITALLLAALAMVAVVWFEYQTTKKPLQDLNSLPWVPEALTSDTPHYALSVYGEAGLALPIAVAVTPSGDKVYVSESGGERAVRVFDASGRELQALIPPGTEVVSRVPLYMALAPDGRVFVGDRPADAVYIYSPEGEFAGEFQPAELKAEEWQPMGLAFDRKGNLYVTNLAPGRHEVLVFDPDGKLTLRFGSEGTEAGQFWFPNGIAVHRDGRIFVADGNNGRVQIFDSRGKLVSFIPRGYGPGDLAMPRGIALDSKDRLFVVDTAAHEVKVYDISGDRPVFRAGFGGFGIDDGQFRFPNGVAADGQNKIYVTDREGGRLQVWSY